MLARATLNGLAVRVVAAGRPLHTPGVACPLDMVSIDDMVQVLKENKLVKPWDLQVYHWSRLLLGERIDWIDGWVVSECSRWIENASWMGSMRSAANFKGEARNHSVQLLQSHKSSWVWHKGGGSCAGKDFIISDFVVNLFYAKQRNDWHCAYLEKARERVSCQRKKLHMYFRDLENAFDRATRNIIGVCDEEESNTKGCG